MGLDAHVNCGCFERGRVKTPPRPEWEVFVDEDGSRASRASDLGTRMEFDAWSWSACEHENGKALHRRIGNYATVGLIRRVLQKRPEAFPLILSKVVYHGGHCGDMLSVDEVKAMSSEVDRLGGVHSDDADDEQILRVFEREMRELVECSLRLDKPIVF